MSENAVTDALKLVQVDTIRGFFAQSISPKPGSSLALFRNGVYVGSTRSQPLAAKSGDIIYHIKLGSTIDVVGQLHTYDRCTREYNIEITTQVIDSSAFLENYLQGLDPVNLVVQGIKDAIQEYADRTLYEEMSPTNIKGKAAYAFDSEPNKLKAGMRITNVYVRNLGEDQNYQPINRSPLLTINSQLTTLEGYVCDYELTVEILIEDQRHYQELVYEGAVPLDRAKVAIDGELQKYASQQSYEDLSKTQPHTIVEQAFDNLASRVTYNMQIVSARRFSLKEPPGYIPPGPRTLTITGKLKTIDYRERNYEMSVILEVANLSEVVQLTRQGNDPLNLVKIAIEGAILHAAEGKTHDELSVVDLPNAAHDAFALSTTSTIGGLKIVKAYKVSLQVDPKFQEQANIEHQSIVERTKLEQQMGLEKLESQLQFEKAQQVEEQELQLTESRQAREKSQYRFDLEKKAITGTYQLTGEFTRKMFSQLTERISDDLKAAVPLEEIQEWMRTLNNMCNLPQITGGNTNQIQYPQNQTLISEESDRNVPLIGSPSSSVKHDSGSSVPTRRIRKYIPQWGIDLMEIQAPAYLQEFVGDQAQAFQVQEVIDNEFIQNSPFQEADILIKINGQQVHTLEALEAALEFPQSTMEIRVMVIRERRREPLTIAAF